ncbi:vicilin-like seed storage protein At2g18540 [Nasonia vitripennis]|uniref:Uncharacterized protein n=1 Tax=Nasonia vitripennis TaxID=7425 RepID=A0A7M7ISV2_NASVI|nr:vicilin-like seed storage protein At2g18540 [Nasonia vitripennis]
MESDHEALEVDLESGRRKERQRREETVKVSWSERAIEEYRRWIVRGGAARTWGEIKVKVGNALQFKKGKPGRREEGKWWDEECRRKKAEMRKAKKEVGKGRNSMEKYRQVKRELRNLCRRKKEEGLKSEIKEAKEDRTGKKFWDMVKKRRKRRREEIDKSIRDEKWLEHFKGQLGEKVGRQDEERGAILETGSENEGGEGEIEVDEVRKIIRKMKERKALGDDEIQNEAWKHGEDLMLEELTEIMGKI